MTTLKSSAPRWKRYVNAVIAAEISSLTRFADRVLQVSPVPQDPGLLLEAVRCGSKSLIPAGRAVPDCSRERDARTVFLLNGSFNHTHDIQGLLAGLKPKCGRTTRLAVVAYNPYWSWLYRLGNRMGWRATEADLTFLTHTDLGHLARLSGFDVVRIRPTAYCPFRLLGLGNLVNRLLPAIPLVRWAAYASVIILRPVIRETRTPSLTVVIPARNERGNIAPAVARLVPPGGCRLDVIFVEGHSTDGTWEEIRRVVARGSRRRGVTLRAFRQTGKGKNDAVRLGFSQARGDLLTILDADLTMPPEMLGRFYHAWVDGHADFINGSRLVYPMEGEAMRLLNWFGNMFFANALSYVLDLRLGDTLCGTKLVARCDYRRMTAWRREFGDFDPFGDFELLFPAAVLGLGITDIPVAYRARTYGQTNISRFRHGWMLLTMTLTGLVRVSTGRVP
ncbi:MAG: glycosyltransferase family 2 protein [Candidatus Coatesbacteria bacterium]